MWFSRSWSRATVPKPLCSYPRQHAVPRTLPNWQTVSTIRGIRSIAVNPRGTGRSEGRLEGLTLHDVADDLAAVVKQRSDFPVHLVGHALGNSFVRCTAADYPELVASVTLLGAGPFPRFNPGPRPSATKGLAMMASGEISTSERLTHIGHFFAPGHDPALWSNGWWPRSLLLVDALFATEPDDWWTAGRTAPVLIVQGRQDSLPPEAGRALVAEMGMRRAKLVELENCGHAMLPEQPDLICRAVIDFVVEHPVAGRETSSRRDNFDQ